MLLNYNPHLHYEEKASKTAGICFWGPVLTYTDFLQDRHSGLQEREIQEPAENSQCG